jgi:hypothetical protein
MKDYKNCTLRQEIESEPMLVSILGGLVLVALTAVICLLAALGAAS